MAAGGVAGSFERYVAVRAASSLAMQPSTIGWTHEGAAGVAARATPAMCCVGTTGAVGLLLDLSFTKSYSRYALSFHPNITPHMHISRSHPRPCRAAYQISISFAFLSGSRRTSVHPFCPFSGPTPSCGSASSIQVTCSESVSDGLACGCSESRLSSSFRAL